MRKILIQIIRKRKTCVLPVKKIRELRVLVENALSVRSKKVIGHAGNVKKCLFLNRQMPNIVDVNQRVEDQSG